jgi:chromosome segregation protein
VIIAEGEDLHAPLVQDNFTVIARSGRFIQRRYSLSGGSIGLFEGKKIGRKKNLEILESEIAKLEKEENRLSSAMYQCQSELEKLKATSHKAEKSGLQNSLNQIRQDIVTLKARQESYELYVKEGGQKIERLEAKNVELMEANAAIEAALDAKMGNAELLRSEIASADINFRQTAEQLSLSSTEYNSCNIELIKQQNKVSNLQRELAYREKSKQETEIAIAGFLNTLNNSDNEIEEINDLLLRLQEELTETYERKKELESNLTYSEQMFFKARGDIHETENAIRALTKKSQDTQIIINTLKDKLSEVKFQLVSLAQRLSIEFNISLNNGELIAIDDTKHEKFDETEIELKVDKIKLRLENYGEINPMAVEAYDEIKKRHEVINSQREDILKAKNDLIETIREIEETATTQFLDAFSRVRLYFIDVFRKLFTSDDTADLVLLNPDNPLESAIEIIAKPKGKKPQTISQLSGGEKTLTATALLFALYLLKPAPFCIFDEVDAPLDDANILKFNNIIQEFSKQSQFIIVTHNKQTMAAVSSIYGIYMAEKGVSSVAQVNFTDLKHEAVLQNVES